MLKVSIPPPRKELAKLIRRYQRPHRRVSEVTIIGDLPQGYEASVEVAVPGIGVYWEIMDAEEVVIADGFKSSARRAHFRNY